MKPVVWGGMRESVRMCIAQPSARDCCGLHWESCWVVWDSLSSNQQHFHNVHAQTAFNTVSFHTPVLKRLSWHFCFSILFPNSSTIIILSRLAKWYGFLRDKELRKGSIKTRALSAGENADHEGDHLGRNSQGYLKDITCLVSCMGMFTEKND